MIFLIPVLLFFVCLVYGLCRSFYECGKQDGTVEKKLSVFLMKEGFNKLGIYGESEATQMFKEQLDNAGVQTRKPDRTNIMTNPIFDNPLFW